jgi:hypothetical protein
MNFAAPESEYWRIVLCRLRVHMLYLGYRLGYNYWGTHAFSGETRYFLLPRTDLNAEWNSHMSYL